MWLERLPPTSTAREKLASLGEEPAALKQQGSVGQRVSVSHAQEEQSRKGNSYAVNLFYPVARPVTTHVIQTLP